MEEKIEGWIIGLGAQKVFIKTKRGVFQVTQMQKVDCIDCENKFRKDPFSNSCHGCCNGSKFQPITEGREGKCGTCGEPLGKISANMEIIKCSACGATDCDYVEA